MTKLAQKSEKTAAKVGQLPEKATEGIVKVAGKTIDALTPSDEWQRRHQKLCTVVTVTTVITAGVVGTAAYLWLAAKTKPSSSNDLP